MEPGKRKTLKRWLRRLITGGVCKKAPDWVVLEIHNLGVPIQMDAERHGTKWEWFVYLEDRYGGEKVDGKELAKEALVRLSLPPKTRVVKVNKKRIRRE